jgi:hypothetical protein
MDVLSTNDFVQDRGGMVHMDHISRSVATWMC